MAVKAAMADLEAAITSRVDEVEAPEDTKEDCDWPAPERSLIVALFTEGFYIGEGRIMSILHNVNIVMSFICPKTITTTNQDENPH